jgi:indole-3-glycerol phosphate synthase
VTVLDGIISGVRKISQHASSRCPGPTWSGSWAGEPVRDPMPAFRSSALSVIAEVKRSSPSKGDLADIPDPAALAAAYEAGGAAAISVLTEQRRFRGSLADLDAVRAGVDVPVLRKDFTVDPYQVWEARAHGADLILLIVAALSDGDLAMLKREADDLGLTCLVEVHTADETRRALQLGATVLGVNNRNLKTLDVDPGMFERLVTLIPADVVRVCESGLLTPDDAARAAAAGADAVLVGEALVRDHAPTRAVADMIAAGTLASYRRP